MAEQTLGDLAADTKSAFATGPFGSAVSARNFTSSGVPMLRGSNLSDDVGVRLNDSNIVFLSEALASEFSRSIVRPGDLVFTSWGTVGQVGIIEDSGRFDRYIVSNKQMKMTPDSGRVSSLFLYYYLSQRSMVELVRAQAIGSSVPGFNLGQLKSLPVSIPSLSVQKAIARVLGALDDKVAVNNRLIRIADELAEARTLSALSGAEVRLSEAALVIMGSSPPGTSYNEQGEGIPFYQGVRDFGVRFPSRRVWTTSPVRLAERGDTLVSVRAPVGRTNLAWERMCLGRGVAGLRSKDGHAMTLFHQVRAAGNVWAPFEAVGTVFGAINKGQLESIALPEVDHSQAERLETDLVDLEHRIAAALAENERLAAARDELLPLLMSGKVQVRDARQVIEGVA